MLKPLSLFVLGVGAWGGNLSAQNSSTTNDTTRYTFALPGLRVTPDARFTGLCNVGIAMPADPNSMHFNASNLVFSPQKFNVGISYLPKLQTTSPTINYLSLYGHLKEKTALGGSLRTSTQFDSSRVQSLDTAAGTWLQQQTRRDVEANISVARKLKENFSVALAGKFIFSGLSTDSSGKVTYTPANTFAVDISSTYQKQFKIKERDASFRAGLAITNIGGKIEYKNGTLSTASNINPNSSYLPANMGLGLSFVYHISEKHSISFAGDFNKLLVPSLGSSLIAQGQSIFESYLNSFKDSPDGAAGELKEFVYSLGMELNINKFLYFRLGHQGADLVSNIKSRLAGGVGFKYSFITVNAALARPLQSSNNGNQANISVLFDVTQIGKKKDKK